MIEYYLKRIREEKYPIRFLISRVLRHSGACRLFKIRRDNYKLKFYPTAVSASLFYDPYFGREDENFLHGVLREGDTFVDVGANIGHLSLCASEIVGDKGAVYAFEPHPKIFKYLQNNIRFNSAHNVCSVNYGLGDQEKTLSLTDAHSDDQNFIDPENKSDVRVEVKRLDDMLKVDAIDLLKVDTEGYEKFVFNGAFETLKKTRMIYFESNCELYARYGYRIEDVLDLLRPHGFKFFCNKDGNLMPFTGKTRSAIPINLVARFD